MQTTLYLVRHAQSHQSVNTHHSQWPLSAVGRQQAQALAALLSTLGVTRTYTSPFLRCRQTLQPFLEIAQLEPTEHHDLREQLLTASVGSREIWEKIWADFRFKLPNCESVEEARERFLRALKDIARQHSGETIAIGTHGMVISLLLNSLDTEFGREQAEMISNPAVIKVHFHEDRFHWDRSFQLDGLDAFATHHDATPVDHGGTP